MTKKQKKTEGLQGLLACVLQLASKSNKSAMPQAKPDRAMPAQLKQAVRAKGSALTSMVGALLKQCEVVPKGERCIRLHTLQKKDSAKWIPKREPTSSGTRRYGVLTATFAMFMSGQTVSSHLIEALSTISFRSHRSDFSCTRHRAA